MSVQRTRPIDTLQRIVTSMKNFEKKLDKLQEDVSVHGQTLSDLRSMVANLSGGTIISAEGKSDENKRHGKRTTATAVQYEEKLLVEETVKPKPKEVVQALPPIRSKSLQSPQAPKLSPRGSPFRAHVNKIDSNPKGISPKHSQRHKKADAIRKAALRTKKNSEKKRSKLTK